MLRYFFQFSNNITPRLDGHNKSSADSVLGRVVDPFKRILLKEATL